MSRFGKEGRSEMREDYQRVYAKISLDAVRENVENMKQNLSGKTGIMAVIKADGYGHGAFPIAKELEKLDEITGFAAATAEEALLLRKAGIQKDILILGYTFPYSYRQLIAEKVDLTVFREDTLEQLSKEAEKLGEEKNGAAAGVHIKVDTGMNRIGIRPDEKGLNLVKKAIVAEGIEVKGIFTHFARADEEDKSAANAQLRIFQDFILRIEEETGYHIPVKHCSNSAGIIEMPQANMDMVRAGIILYGLWPSEEVHKDIVPLKPVLSLHSRIVYVKEITKGDAVSYGGTFTASGPMKTATIPTGYGDGYPRGLSGKGYVLIRGQRAPVLGRICMDQFMVDVSDIDGVREGDEVTLIGRDGEEIITMEELGKLSGRFNYELACDLGKRIPRVYEKGGQILYTKDYYQDF